ncbi:AraC family transcriptional regulator [Pelagibacterium lentulum]|uniref:AraC family transcriptional regulator n=1 Tax=Pelagibacterium lentulum TaxID=2029865 RepID=A0A916VV50_9HYPH|nr:AraC family transcriptional regulator [Pelagibacterium lentulum]
MPRPDRRFYAHTRAFGRFGVRWFAPQLMDAEHWHGHIEFNWLTDGGMDYIIDGRPVSIPANRLVMFWAGVPHKTVSLKTCASDARQCNIYLPLDAFLYMTNLGELTEIMMGGGIIALPVDAVDKALLERWYGDYRSGDAERTDILRSEIANMLRRTALVGWDVILEPWIESITPATRSASPLRYVVAMVKYVLEHLSEPLSSKEIAKVVGLHPNYALNLFTSVMGISVQKFVIRMRLIRARSLLFEGNISIANVAFESGFTSLSQFYEHFRAGYGTTPREMQIALAAHGHPPGTEKHY